MLNDAVLRTLRAVLPGRDWFAIEVVAHLPIMALRMFAYRLLGVSMSRARPAAIMRHTEVWSARKLAIGEGSVIGRHALIDARGHISIGRDVNISSYCRFQSAKHVVDDPDFVAAFEPITVGDRAWIGMGATVLGGVSIGEGAVVAAGAVVTKDVEPYEVVGGVPARPLRTRSRDLRYELDYRPTWL